MDFTELLTWSANTLLGRSGRFTNAFPFTKIGRILARNRENVVVQDDVFYKRPTIQLYGKGVKVRDEVQGKDIGTKNQFMVRSGQFMMSKIDARNGAFGIAGADMENVIATNDFPVFDILTDTVIPEYFELLMQTKHFREICQNASSGTTGRQRVNETELLNYEIPLPPLPAQQQLVTDYQARLETARLAEAEIANLETAIETYVNQTLSIEISRAEVKKGLQFVESKDLTRWDFDYLVGSPNNIFTVLAGAKYPLQKIGVAYQFVTRSWDKKNYLNETFRYVEIGGIEPSVGITHSTEIALTNAPSRATQIIKAGDLILGLTRPYLKKFAVVDDTFSECVCSSGFQVIEPNSENDSQFLLEFLKTVGGVKQFEYFMSGAIYPAITSEQLRNLQIPLPPLLVQQEIVARVGAMRATITALKTSMIWARQAAKEAFEKALFA